MRCAPGQSVTECEAKLRGGNLKAGAIWSSLTTGSSVVVPFLLFILFARLAPANQIGLMAYGLAWVELIKGAAPQGVYEAFLARQANDWDGEVARLLMTVMVVSGLIGFIIYLPILTVVPVHSLGERVAVLALGLRIPLDLLAIQPTAVIAKRLDFRRMALRTMVANIGSAIIGVIIAVKIHPLTGMVVYYLAQSTLVLVVTATAKAAVARPFWSLGRVKLGLAELGGQPFSASFVRTVAAANNYLDQIVIGAFLPLRELARFNLGKRLETTLMQVASTFSNILFQPAFAARKTVDGHIVVQRCVVLMTVLCGAPVAVFIANHTGVVEMVFGARWSSAAGAAAFLAISGLARAVGSVPGAFLSVNNRNSELLRYSLISSVGGIVAVAATGRLGVTWCAFALALRSVAALIWVIWMMRGVVRLRFWTTRIFGLVLALVVGAYLGRWIVGLAPLPLNSVRLVLQVLASSFTGFLLASVVMVDELLPIVTAAREHTLLKKLVAGPYRAEAVTSSAPQSGHKND